MTDGHENDEAGTGPQAPKPGEKQNQKANEEPNGSAVLQEDKAEAGSAIDIVERLVEALNNNNNNNNNNSANVKFSLPQFHGHNAKSKHLMYEQWLFLAKQVLNDKHIKETDKEKIILNALQDEARHRYVDLGMQGKTRSEILDDIFKKEYSDNTDAVERSAIMHKVKQKPNESLEDYIVRFDAKRRWANRDNQNPLFETDVYCKRTLADTITDRQLAKDVRFMLKDEDYSYADFKIEMLQTAK